MYEGPVVWELTMHIQCRVVFKKNTSTEDECNKDTCNNTEEKHREYRKLHR